MKIPTIGKVYRNQQTNKLYKILAVAHDPNFEANAENPAVGRVVIYTRYGSDGKKLFTRSVEDFYASVEKGGDGEEAGKQVKRFIQVVPKTWRNVEIPQFGVQRVPDSWRIAKSNKGTVALGVAGVADGAGAAGE